jgi:hypothetical protein
MRNGGLYWRFPPPRAVWDICARHTWTGRVAWSPCRVDRGPLSLLR